MSRTLLVLVVMTGLFLVSGSVRGDEESDDLDALIKRLQDEDPAIQNQALFDIMFSCRASLPALPSLAEVARKSTKENRLSALKLLGEYGLDGQAAVPLLREAITDGDIEIRIHAAHA